MARRRQRRRLTRNARLANDLLGAFHGLGLTREQHSANEDVNFEEGTKVVRRASQAVAAGDCGAAIDLLVDAAMLAGRADAHSSSGGRGRARVLIDDINRQASLIRAKCACAVPKLRSKGG